MIYQKKFLTGLKGFSGLVFSVSGLRPVGPTPRREETENAQSPAAKTHRYENDG